MKKYLFFISIAALSIVLYLNMNRFAAEETITFFPIDPSVQYKSAYTNLVLKEKQDADGYLMQWRLGSKIDKKAYLRQDIGFVYSNGRLISKMGQWKQNTDRIDLEETIEKKESSFFQAISFHHSETHKNDEIGSAQRMSGDELYVVDSNFSPLHSFLIAKTKEEKEWKKVLNQSTNQTLQNSWARAKKVYSINDNKYNSFPLTDILKYNTEPLPSFTKAQSDEVIGKLWEGIYKNYFLGIKKQDGTVIDPNDSTIPLILVAKDKSHLLVIFETKDGEPIQLRQLIKVIH